MKHRCISLWAVSLAAALVLIVAVTAPAATAPQLKAALQQMASPQLDETSALKIESVTIEKEDFSITLSDGTLYFLRPLTVDTLQAVYGAFFSGRAQLTFTPELPMEQGQLERFYESPAMNRRCEDVMLLFTGSTLEQLRQAGKPARSASDKKKARELQERFETFQKYLGIREDYSFLFNALRNMVFPRKQSYLLVNADITGGNQVFYVYDPYEREEVQFYRYYKQFIVPYMMELVCSYSVYADTTYAMLNGMDKAQVSPTRYVTNTIVEGDARVSVTAAMDLVSQMTPIQMLKLILHERMTVDSIKDSLGRPVEFVRWSNRTNRNTGLWLMLPEPLKFQQEEKLTFWYHGEPIEQRVSQMYVDVNSTWYPQCENGFTGPVKFVMTFRTPARYGFVASGKLLGQEKVGDTLITTWQTDSTAFNASFNIGNFNRFEYTLKDLPRVDIYHLEQLHKDSTQDLLASLRTDDERREKEAIDFGGKNMQGQVADDVIGSLQVFTQRYGPLPYDVLAASEVLDTARYGFLARRFSAEGAGGNRFVDMLSDRSEFSAENEALIRDTSTARLMNPTQIQEKYDAPLFPGESYTNLLLLRYETFQRPDKSGGETRYRVHGVASQWWQQSMAPESYHDMWLAAALSEYSSLIYLQAARGNDQFLYWIGKYHGDLLSATNFFLKERQPMGALALGPRSATTESRDDYEWLMYRKGSLVIHMLRQMLLDLETFDESRFFTMMRDYYTTFRGRRVSTNDFRAITEKHTGVDMKWFFDQWVYGSYVPKYKFSYDIDEAEGKGYTAKLRIKQEDVPENFKAYIPVEVEFDSGDRAYVRLLVDKPEIEQEVAFDSRPKKLRLNPFASVIAKIEQ